MYSFFVLGLVPGTSFQITFIVWLDMLFVTVDAYCLYWLAKRYPDSVFGGLLSIGAYLLGRVGTFAGHLVLLLKQSSLLEEQYFQEISAGSSD